MSPQEPSNPFSVLELAPDAPTEKITEHGRLLSDEAVDADAGMRIREAVEQLRKKPEDRLLHELFEVPHPFYLSHERDWTRFVKKFRRNPVNGSLLTESERPPSIDDLNLPALIHLIYKGWLAAPGSPIGPALDDAPVDVNPDTLPLEITDVLFT